MKGTTNIPVVCVIMKNAEDRVLFILRSNTGWMDGNYGLPGGHVEAGESFTQAACREVLEEVGIDLNPKDLEYLSTMHLRDEATARINVTFKVTKWSGEPNNMEPAVHSEIAWLDPHDLPPNIVPVDIDRVTQSDAYEKYLEIGWQE
jgi:8-oxo-dGTP diphosphatase